MLTTLCAQLAQRTGCFIIFCWSLSQTWHRADVAWGLMRAAPLPYPIPALAAPVPAAAGLDGGCSTSGAVKIQFSPKAKHISAYLSQDKGSHLPLLTC